jgi:hypothetical protein
MQTANENGVFETEATEELARRGRSYAAVGLCQRDDGLYRYALDMVYSYGGFCDPIFASSKGFATRNEAKDAGTVEFLRRFPKGFPTDPPCMREELAELRAQIGRRMASRRCSDRSPAPARIST